MKKGLWLIFKCQNCGKVFQEKPPKGTEIKKDHIGKYGHIISTHRCGPGKNVYGCAALIGAKDWDEAALEGGEV